MQLILFKDIKKNHFQCQNVVPISQYFAKFFILAYALLIISWITVVIQDNEQE